MKRKDWIIGAWYHNPMMERSGIIKARYVKIESFDTQKFESCTAFTFNEWIMPDGTWGDTPITQSNGDFDKEMVLVPENTINGILLGLPYGI